MPASLHLAELGSSSKRLQESQLRLDRFGTRFATCPHDPQCEVRGTVSRRLAVAVSAASREARRAEAFGGESPPPVGPHGSGEGYGPRREARTAVCRTGSRSEYVRFDIVKQIRLPWNGWRGGVSTAEVHARPRSRTPRAAPAQGGTRGRGAELYEAWGKPDKAAEWREK